MTVRIAVIGYGRWGQHYLRLLRELPSCEVVGMSDSDPRQLAQARERYPEVPIFDKPQRALESEADAVIIATPASTHYELVCEALKVGKHVLVEKPFVLEVSQATELIEMAEELGRVLMVGYVFLYNPGVQKLKEYMRNDEVGDIYYLYATRTNLGPIRRDVNVIWDLAPHDVSIFSFLLDSEPLRVSAHGSRFSLNSQEDVAFLTLTYPDGIVGHIHVSWANPHRVREVAVVGSRKRLVFDDLNPLEKVRVYEKGVEWSGTDKDGFGDFMLSIRDGAIVSPVVEAVEPLREQCMDFVRGVQDGTTPLAGAQWGASGVRVLVAAQRSLAAHGAEVEVSGT